MEYSLKGKKVLVTGGTGYIGSHVLPRLTSLGAIVRVLTRSTDKGRVFSDPSIEYCTGNLADQESLANVIKDSQVIFHFAAVLGDKFKSLPYYRLVNVDGTRRLAEAALENNIERFFHVSSVWAYGLVSRSEINETFPLSASDTPYGDTKMEGQQIVQELLREKGLPVVIIQPGDVYGPKDMKWTIDPMRLMKAGKFQLVNGGAGLFQPIFIDDVVDGILLAAQKGKVGESYILCGEEILTFREYFQQLADIVEVDKLPSVPYRFAMTMATLAEAFAKLTNAIPPFTRTGVRGTYRQDTYSIKKAQKELGFKPKTITREGIKKIRAWWKTEESLW